MVDANDFNRDIPGFDDPASLPAAQVANHLQPCDPSLNEAPTVILEPAASVDGNQTFEARVVYRGLSFVTVN
jgi:hypothetical protein